MKFSSIARYKGNKYLLKAGAYVVLCKLEKNKFKFLARYVGKDVYIPFGNAKTSKAGSVCDSDGNLYLVYSYVQSENSNNLFFYELRGISYIIKRTPVINYKKKTMSFKGEEIYEYVAGNKVSWRNDTNKKKGYSPQLEMEDACIYDGKLFFNTEGGTDCFDLLGQSE